MVVSILENTTQHGAIDGKTQTNKVKYYNLDAIISIGYRVNSQKATKFRIWATDILKDYIQKGFKIDVERMKQGENAFGKDYFRELLETVRSIRASERRIWQQITDVFAEISYDYDKTLKLRSSFMPLYKINFTMLLLENSCGDCFNGADKTKENMGLTTWKTLQMEESYSQMYQLLKIIYQKNKFAVLNGTYLLILIMLSDYWKMKHF